MERLHILDGHGYVFRAHFGLMNASRGERKDIRLSNKEGMPTGAMYVFSRMLMRLHDDLRPERMVVVFDAGRKSFRTELYPEYKAHRPPTPEDLVVQMPYFRRLVEAMRWPVLSIAGVEADDVIATLVTKAKARKWDAVVYSADKDLMQLVGDGVTQIDSLRQRTYSPAEVEEKFGVPPAHVADFLALVGDTSDNVPGLSGVGEKTAANLIKQYGSVEDLIKANPVVPRIKIKQPFGDPEQIARVRLSRQLVELKRDVELGVEIDALKSGLWDEPALRTLFTELEFSGLLTKLDHGGVGTATTVIDTSNDSPVQTGTSEALGKPAVAHSTMAAASGLPTIHAEVAVRKESLDAIAAAARAAAKAGRAVALWLEDDGQRPEHAKIVSLAIAVTRAPFADSSDVDVAYLPLGHRYIGAPTPALAADLTNVYAMLADAKVAKVGHDIKRILRLGHTHGIVIEGLTDDTMLAQFLLDSTEPAEAIDQLATLAGTTLPSRKELLGRGAQHGLETVAVEQALPWVASASTCVLTTAPRLIAQLESQQLTSLYHDVELPIARLLAVVERTGICVDVPMIRAVAERVGNQLATLERSVWAMTGEEFNLGSPKQLGVVLFDKLKLFSDRVKKTKTGYSTDRDVLESLIEMHPVIRPLLEHRELSKLKGTYLDALPPLVDPKTSRLHTTFNQVAAATGRISSQDPNLQNIPIRSELGREIRRGFVAAPGHVLIASDYSQIELRILAHLSGDPLLSRAFREKIDVHTQTAAEIFGIDPSKVGAKERRVAKAVNYGLSYGQSDFGLARVLDIPRAEAKLYSDRYFARVPTIRAFMDGIAVKARAEGGVHTLLGRWRPIPELAVKNAVVRKAAERVAQNTPMQGAGADILKLAMLRTTARLAKEGVAASMLLTVHDELVFEAKPEVADDVAALVKAEMENVFPLSVPLDVDVGIAANWADA